jgi:hypothetical protein
MSFYNRSTARVWLCHTQLKIKMRSPWEEDSSVRKVDFDFSSKDFLIDNVSKNELTILIQNNLLFTVKVEEDITVVQFEPFNHCLLFDLKKLIEVLAAATTQLK